MAAQSVRRWSRWAVGAATLGLALVSAPVPTALAATSPTSGYVTAVGTQLSVNGQPWKFAGYNLPCANPFDLSAASLGFYLDDIQTNSGANAIRVWFFQSQGGPGNWTNFDNVIAALKARGMRAIVTLANETSTCDEPSASTFYKTESWYQTGYLSPEGGYSLSFHDYAKAVAAHYANEPTVAFWQLINEAQAPSYNASDQLTCDEAGATAALRSFSDNMVATIRSVDPNHLVDLGTMGPGACGIINPADYDTVHAGALSLCEYHDYGAPAQAMPSGLASVLSGCDALHKPTFIGESGIPANVGPDGTPSSTCTPWPSCSPTPITITSLDQRAAFFDAKIKAASAAGVAGYLIWVKSPFYSDTTDGYAIGDGDPTEAVLPDALAAYPQPPANVPEAPWAAELVVVGAAVAGAYVLLRRRLRRRQAAASG